MNTILCSRNNNLNMKTYSFIFKREIYCGDVGCSVDQNICNLILGDFCYFCACFFWENPNMRHSTLFSFVFFIFSQEKPILFIIYIYGFIIIFQKTRSIFENRWKILELLLPDYKDYILLLNEQGTKKETWVLLYLINNLRVFNNWKYGITILFQKAKSTLKIIQNFEEFWMILNIRFQVYNSNHPFKQGTKKNKFK